MRGIPLTSIPLWGVLCITDMSMLKYPDSLSRFELREGCFGSQCDRKTSYEQNTQAIFAFHSRVTGKKAMHPKEKPY